MSGRLLYEGGPHHIRRLESDKYEFRITIPKDEHGRIARECPDENCSPGYFKIKTGTGITSGQEVAYCPYCRKEDEPDNFATKEQVRYAKDVTFKEAEKGIDKLIKDTFGLGLSGKKKVIDGIVSMEMEYKSRSAKSVRSPFEEEIQRAVICPNCGLDHAVFGLAIWCPDCGRDIFIKHIEAEFAVIKTILGDVERRKHELGPRIAAKDLENCLEDVVTIFETALKSMVIRYLREQGKNESEIKALLDNRIRNGFQNPEKAKELIFDQFGQDILDVLDTETINQMIRTFSKRHPITHNLGVIDRKYLERTLEDEKEGREIRVAKQEIVDVIDISLIIISNFHEKLWPER